MKKNKKIVCLIFSALFILFFSGCAGLFGVNIRTQGNLSSVLAGGTLSLSSSGRDIIWTVSSTSDGSGPVANGTFITQNGLLTVDVNEPSSVLYVIVTSSRDGTTAVRQIRIVTVTDVSVSPINQTVAIGRTSQFRAQVSGQNNPDSTVTWRVSSNASGSGAVTQGTSISSNGTLTVSANESLRTLFVIATSSVDTSKSGSVSVTVVVPTVTSVTVSPANQTVVAGSTIQFRAAVTGTYDPATTVTWAVSSNAAGTGVVTPGTSISNSGLLTVAPTETLPTLHIFATSTVDPTKSDRAVISVVVPTVNSVIVSPANQTISAGSMIQFSAVVSGVNLPHTNVTWRVSSNAAGTGAVTPGTAINANGLLTISADETSRMLFIFAVSEFDPSRAGSVVIYVTEAIVQPPAPTPPTVTGVTVTPANQTVTAGATRQFSATVTGANNPGTAVTWRVSSNASGTGAVTQGTSISANGLLTVSANESLGTLYVIAASVADTTRSGSVSVTINTPAPTPPTVTGVTVTPANQTVTAGATRQFSATVTGANNPGTSVTWRVSSNAAGTGAVTQGTSISANGLLTVSENESLGTLYVIATSVADTTRSGSVFVSINIPAPTPPTVTSVSVTPANQTVTAGATLQFSATVTGTNNPGTAVTWRVSSNAAGTGAVTQGTSISANGLLTVSENETISTLYVAATSVADTSRSGSATVTVNRPSPTVTGVSVTPANQTVTAGATLQFSATVTGTNNPSTAVTWRVSSNAAGTGAVTQGTSISGSGLLTVSANETISTLYVAATSVTDTSRSGSATVTVNRPSPTVTGVSVTPANQTVTAGATLQFSATVTGTNNPGTAVTWRVSSNAAGTGAVTQGTSISANGLLTVSANETISTLYVAATSVADTSRSGSATVTVNRPSPTVTSISISPSTQNMERGSSYQFSAIVRGDNNPSSTVTWRVSSNAAGTGAVTSGTSINSSGLLTVSASETNATLYVIATSTVNTGISGSSVISVIIRTPTVTSISISPSTQNMTRGSSYQFSAIVRGDNNPSQAVTWVVSTNAAGTGSVASGTSINASGLLRIASNESASTLYVIATSTADNTKTGASVITVRRGEDDQGQDNNAQ